jgi:predicted protein tyrosine phosphatase
MPRTPFRILFVCRAGKDRSRTAAELVAASVQGVETRHGGVDQDARTPVDQTDLDWADSIWAL